MTQAKENTPQAIPDPWKNALPVAIATLTEIAHSKTAGAADRLEATKALVDAQRALVDAQRALAAEISRLGTLHAERTTDVFG